MSVADEVASQLNSIKDSSEKVNTLIAEIRAASKEQAQGIDQVNTAVSEMDKVVQKNAADSEESASAAEERSSQAAEMERMVAELKALVEGRGSAGGKAGAGGQRQNRQQALVAPRTSSQAGQQKQAGRQASGNARSEKGEHSRQQNADQVIPLDDDEFKDF